MNAVPHRQDIADVNPSNAGESAPFLPMLVYPSLAEKLGLNEAIVIAQLHYWLEKSKHTRIEDGCRWIWNTVNNWLKQFCWMSRSTLERVIAKLEKLGVILSQKFWKRECRKGNQTKWYRLDYKKLQEDYDWSPTDKPQPKSFQTNKTKPVGLTESITSNCENRFPQNDGMLSEITIQRLDQIPSTALKAESERVCDFLEKEQDETESSQQTPTSLKEAQTNEPGSKQQSFASLEEKPKPCYKLKDPDRDKIFRHDVVHEIHETHELLKNPVFVQWWVKRVENSDFGKKLYLPSSVFVKNEIRNKPKLALDMWECFQEEMTRRVESFNQRQERGYHIPEYEREEISAIVPYSSVTLQPIQATLASATEPSLSEFVVQERQKLGMGIRPSGCTTANNFPSRRLLTPEEFEARKKEVLRQFVDNRGKSSIPPVPDLNVNQNIDYNKSKYLGIPDPVNPEVEEVKNGG